MRTNHAVRLILHFLLNIALVWGFDHYFPEYFIVTGGIQAYVIIGALITLMNLLVRPVLSLLTFPLKLFATILAIILVNGVFLWITYQVTLLMSTEYVTLTYGGGVGGYIFLTLIFGFANWLERVILKSST